MNPDRPFDRELPILPGKEGEERSVLVPVRRWHAKLLPLQFLSRYIAAA